MRRLTDREFHFEIKAELMQVEHATIRDLAGPETKRKLALDIEADAMWARLADLKIYRQVAGEKGSSE